MNFLAIIGIADEQSKLQDKTIISVKVEKPFVENSDEDWYDLIEVEAENDLFKDELNKLEKGSIIGIKGRIKKIGEKLSCVCERMQIF
ncbi:MAG: hypothetical protein LBM76_00690 [Mycoplasmataceae bacterium]|jgi:hypothetical protein|nr:hypothetical protein [Mycoplasmataceae bacterium]